MTPVMEQLQITGMDGFAATMPAGFLIDFDPEHGVSQTMAATGRLAENAGQFFVVAAHFRNGLYEDARAEVGPAMGAHGQTLDAPRPLSDLWWSNNLRPLILGAARASALMPGLQGMVLDLELYNAGSLAYGEGYAYDDETWGLVTAELTRLNEDAGRSAAALPLGDRMAWLVDQGLVEFAYTFLERTVAERARLIIEAARELNPTFELLLYTHALQTGWFYRGLYRGFGSSERPAVVLSYDQNTNQVRHEVQLIRSIQCLHTQILITFKMVDSKMK